MSIVSYRVSKTINTFYCNIHLSSIHCINYVLTKLSIVLIIFIINSCDCLVQTITLNFSLPSLQIILFCFQLWIIFFIALAVFYLSYFPSILANFKRKRNVEHDFLICSTHVDFLLHFLVLISYYWLAFLMDLLCEFWRRARHTYTHTQTHTATQLYKLKQIELLVNFGKCFVHALLVVC